jgi:serine/threonine protein kinase
VCESWLVGEKEAERRDGVEGERREEREGRRDEDHVRCVLMTLRLLIRDEIYQGVLRNEAVSLTALGKCFADYAEAYLTGSHQKINSLKEMSNIIQKVSSSGGECVEVCPGVLPWLVRLLGTRDLTLTQCCLCALINICKRGAGVDSVAALSPLPPLLHLLQFSDPVSRQKSSDLLLLLVSQSPLARDALRDLDGLSLSLRLLHSEDLHILHRMVSVVERLCEDTELQEDFRLLGGVPLLLSLLGRDSGRSEDKMLALKSVVASAVTQLAVNDTNSAHFTQENGVYLLSKLVLPNREGDSSLVETLQRNSWRALRYLYSTERSRRRFQKAFPPKLFEQFTDIGHYVRDSGAYSPLLHTVDSMSEAALSGLRSAIEETSINRSPIFTVGGYSAHELLGSGAFGNVYKVKRLNSDNFLAMKEIKSSLPLIAGTTATEKSASIGKIMNEVNIIREQLHHPNVVLYHKCFQEGGHLYIVMELIEGAPLSDIITSLADKRGRFEEERIWRIFTQLTLALRYLHKEKHVIHRDLKPSNLMVGEKDKLTITDFGLAKQKENEFSVMQSTVGTLSYWCPELVKNEPYTEKADIWAAGCILYQMATLQVPFHTTNILTLAKKIAEVNYPPIPEGHYSALLTSIVSRCLTGEARERPDSVELGALIASQLMAMADRLAAAADQLQLRLERERQRTLRHRQRYHHLMSLTTPTNLEATPTPRVGSAGRSSQGGSETFLHHPPLVTSPTSSHSPSVTRTTPSFPHRALEPHPPPERAGMEWGLNYSPVLFHKEVGGMESRLEWDGDSDNVFPENQMTSSPGNLTGFHGNASSEASPVGVKRESPYLSKVARGRSYSAVVPGHTQRHHSGRGHGNVRSQTASCESGRGLLGVGVVIPGSPLRYRTSSSSSLLSLSSRQLREISDPISQLMATLHRLLSLTLSAPSLQPHSARLLVLDRYQRSLFHSDMSPEQIKGELHRLSTCSAEGVWLLEEGAWSVGPRLLSKAFGELSGTLNPLANFSSFEPCTLTYDLLAAMIDSLHNERAVTQ